MAHKKQITKRQNNTSGLKKSKIHPSIIVAIIGVAGTSLATLLGFPPLINLLNSKLTPTSAITITETFTPVPSETPIITLEFSVTPDITETPSPSFTDTPIIPTESRHETMTVILTASSSNVKLQQQVNFNAKDSYVTFENGTTSSCVNNPNACSFTWTVSRDGKVVNGPIQGSALFSYTFEKRGNHTVVAHVCRGAACSSTMATIEVR